MRELKIPGKKIVFLEQGYGNDKKYTDKLKAQNKATKKPVKNPVEKPDKPTKSVRHKLSEETLKIGELAREGLTPKEISEIVGIVPSKVQQRIGIYERYQEE